MKAWNWKKVVCMSFVYIVLALMYLPIIVLMIFSFTPGKVFGVWNGFSLDVYIELFKDAEIMKAVANTLVIAVVSSVLATLIGTISAVGIFYMRKLSRTLMNSVSQITIINAEIVTGICLMLLFINMSKIGIKIPDGFATLIISHTVITIPYVILSVTPRLSQLNPNLYEAGLDLGASPMRTMMTVIMPMLIPGMISGFALAFTLSLDDFVVTKFNNGGIETISTLIYKSTKHGIRPAFRALSTIIFVLVLSILLVINIKARKKKVAG